MATARLSFSYSEDLKEKLQTLAEKDSRTLSSFIQKILMKEIEENFEEEPNTEPDPESVRIKRTKRIKRKR